MIIQGKKISESGIESLKRQGFECFRGVWRCKCNYIADRDGTISVAVSLGLKPSSKFYLDSMRNVWIVSLENV